MSTCVLWYACPPPHHAHTNNNNNPFKKTSSVNLWPPHTFAHAAACTSTHSRTHTQPIHTTQTHILHYVTKEQVIKLIHGKIIRKYTFQIKCMNGHITYDIPYYSDSTYLSVKVIQIKSIL